MIYLLGNRIHIRMKIYSVRILLEKYKNWTKSYIYYI